MRGNKGNTNEEENCGSALYFKFYVTTDGIIVSFFFSTSFYLFICILGMLQTPKQR